MTTRPVTPEHVQVDTRQVLQAVRNALGLVRRHYNTSPAGGGGWYHELEHTDPGTTATALGLMIFDACRERNDHHLDALSYLRAVQVSSTDPRIDGGWATKSSHGRPVVEATAWVARMIGALRCQLADGAPSATRALRWLVENQNGDGGWGSLHGCPSRVWLTCLALRGIHQLDPVNPAIDRGVSWLLEVQRSPSGAWGTDRSAQEPSLVPTAMALVTLSELRPRRHRTALRSGYDWLVAELADGRVDDLGAKLEVYSVPFGPAGAPGRLVLWQYGVPVAVSALLRHPDGPPLDLAARLINTLLTAQSPDGHWRKPQNESGLSLWGVWWCTQALCDLERVPLVRAGDIVVPLREAVVVKRPGARELPLWKLLPRQARVSLGQIIARHWASALLAVCGVAGLLAVWGTVLEWQDFALGLAFPIVLFGVQELRNRRSGPAPS